MSEHTPYTPWQKKFVALRMLDGKKPLREIAADLAVDAHGVSNAVTQTVRKMMRPMNHDFEAFFAEAGVEVTPEKLEEIKKKYAPQKKGRKK